MDAGIIASRDERAQKSRADERWLGTRMDVGPNIDGQALYQLYSKPPYEISYKDADGDAARSSSKVYTN